MDRVTLSTPSTGQPATPARPAARLGLWLLVMSALLLSGCGRNNRDIQSGVDELYERGNKSMSNGNFRNAIQYYEGLEARYPFSNQARQAQLNLIYTYYRNGDSELAIDAAEQFERENPTHPRVDYALYMRGLANFAPQHRWYHKMFRVDLAKRPPVNARESFSAFSRLLQKYPDSIYAEDARQRMIFLRNRLAEHENYVADYYFRRGAYVAAMTRARYTMLAYDGAPAVADAMFIIARSYEKLGMQDLAADTWRTLDYNYPDARQPATTRKRFIFF